VSKDNKVLFAGGLIYDLTSYSRVDIYDTQTGFWSMDDLSLARGAMASAVVGDLAIFAGGLRSGAAVTNRVDFYNFTTGIWSTAALSQARCQAEAITIGNKVLIAGGMTAGFADPTDRVDIYNAETNTWDTASLSVARMSCGAAVINGKAYFAGGGSFGSGAVLSDLSDIIDIYDPESDTWSVEYLNQPVASQSVLGVCNHLLVAGGKTNGDLRVKTVQMFYDPQPGILNSKDDGSFRIYPNPSSGNFHIEMFNENHQKPILATIYNLQGQMVFTQMMEPRKLELNLDLPAGMYVLRIVAVKTTYSELITIQK
jgi:kelch-like protein 1/4/5